MKAYLIDPTKKAVEQIDYDGDGAKIPALIGATSGVFAAVRLPDDHVAYVDDEGLLVSPNPNGYFHLLGIPQVFAGKALVVGTGPDGEDIEPTLPLRMFELVTSFIDNPAPESIEPKMEVMSLDEARERGVLPPALAAALLPPRN